MPHSFKVRYISCPVKSCTRQFTNQGSLKNHIQMHRTPQANHDEPVHPLVVEDILDIQEDAQGRLPVDEPHLSAPEGHAKEKIIYYPLINGLPLRVPICQK